MFRPDGTVTAGNCCPLNDGAAAVIVMSDTKAAELGITPLARIISTGVTALSPEIMGLGPVEASRQALAGPGLTIDDVDLVEINEAFAAQVIPSYRDLGIDIDKLNVNGGAIAVGHPFGMTGARITSTLLNSLQFHDKTFGLETMCVGGGQGMAMIFERLAACSRSGRARSAVTAPPALSRRARTLPVGHLQTGHYGRVTAGGCQARCRWCTLDSKDPLTLEVQIVPDPLSGDASEPDRPHPDRHGTSAPRVVQPA